MYKRKEVFDETVKYFNGDELAAKVWMDKYCLKNIDGELLELTPDDMHWRLANEIARIEAKYPHPMDAATVYSFLKDFKRIVPQGSPMYGIGNDVLSSISNCFVIGQDIDSYGGIMFTDQEQVQLMKRRGGVGHDLSHIRPYGENVDNSALASSGVVPFMERYSNSTREVAQNGRNGALMLSLDVHHPDSDRFIDAKMDTSKITGANVSIRASDIFMEAVVNGKDYDKLYMGVKFGSESAQPIFNKLIHNAWKSAEPGIFFWDRVLNESPARGYGERFKEKSTNPCGELPLAPWASCLLLAVNLYSYVDNKFTPKASLKAEELMMDVMVAQKIMDDIVDIEIEKVDAILAKVESGDEPDHIKSVEKNLWTKIRGMVNDSRRTGLGYTGLGDLMAALGITYGTEQGINFISELQQLFGTSSYVSSVLLAEERGAFPLWEYDKDQESDFIKRMFSKENVMMNEHILKKYKATGRRNIGNLTIAPTGTTSLMTQTTSGIEPVFYPWHFRKKKTDDPIKATITDEVGDMWEEFAVFHRPFVEWFITWNSLGLTFDEGVVTLNKKTKGELTSLLEFSPYHNATAQDVNYINKVKMQGKAQEWVDHSISVTVNMPKDVTEELVKEVYIEAWRSGCKGVTVYRDGSRLGVLNVEKTDNSESFVYQTSFKRPKTVECDVYFKKHLGTEYIHFVGLVEGKPLELFAVPYSKEFGIPRSLKKGSITKVKKRHFKFESGDYEIDNLIDHMLETEQNQTRDYSLMLRHRVDPKYIKKDILAYATISSFQKGVAAILDNYIQEDLALVCTECGGKIVVSDGCKMCVDCGNTKCG